MPYVKKAELVEILAGLGETAPVKWTREQILLRIQEIEEETKVAPKDTKVIDEVQELRRALNKAARKKSDLQAFCTQQLGLELTMNETIEKLKVKAESVLAQKAPPRGDELMGFGKHAGLSFGQVMMNHHDYVSWAVQSYHEGPVNWRLERFVKWYLNHTGRPLAAKASHKAAPEPETEAPGPSTPALGTNTKMKKGMAGATPSPTSMGLTPSAAGSPMNMGPTTPTSELFRSPWNGPVPGSVGARSAASSASAGPSWAVPTPPEHRPVPGTPDEAASDPDSEELLSMDDDDAERIRALEEELQELRRKRNQKSPRGRHV